MNDLKTLGAVALLAGLTAPGVASAAVIGAGTLDAPGACASVPGSGVNGAPADCKLQTILDTMTQGGSSSVNVVTDQYGPDEVWTQGSLGSGFGLVLEIAGNAGINTFGIYDVTNPTNFVEIFDGAASGPIAGPPVTLFIAGDGSVFVNGTDTTTDFGSLKFGFYLDGEDGTLFSEASRNSGGFDAMVAYQGGNGDQLDAGLGFRPWLANEFLLGWEDKLNLDDDYQDMLVFVESVIGVPEPGSLALLGLGLIGLGRARARRRSQKQK